MSYSKRAQPVPQRSVAAPVGVPSDTERAAALGSHLQIQAEIGATKAAAFDVTAACSGFVVGVVTATHLMRGGNFRNVLVVGADALSRYVDWRDRGTCILFGDGCGALLLQAQEGECNMLGFDVRSDGALNK